MRHSRIKWLTGLAPQAVIIVLALGADLPEYIAHFIREWRMERLSDTAAQRARDTARSLDWRGLDSGEWTCLRNSTGSSRSTPIKDTITGISRSKLSVSLPTELTRKLAISFGGHGSVMMRAAATTSLWTGRKAIDATFVAVNPRRTDVFVNGWMVFLNATAASSYRREKI